MIRDTEKKIRKREEKRVIVCITEKDCLKEAETESTRNKKEKQGADHGEKRGER